MEDISKNYFIDNLSNLVYNDNNFTNKDSKNISDIIHDNLLKIRDDQNLLEKMYLKVSSQAKMIKTVLEYEMLNYIPETKEICNTPDDVIKIIQREIKIYFKIVEGYSVEDTKWINCRENRRFKLDDDQSAIFNTISPKLLYDKRLLSFFKNFVSHIKNLINRQKFKVKYKTMISEYNQIAWLLFVVREVNKNHEFD